MTKVLSLIYGLTAYALFLIVFLYLVGFVGNLLVPKSIDTGPGAPVIMALTVNLFLVALFFAPVVRMLGGGVPVEGGAVLNPVTAPALVVVGCLMARCAARVPWEDPTEAFPAFLILAGIPFFRSIADGIAFGFIAYPAIKLLTGRAREVSPLVHVLGLLLLLRYVLL